MKLNPVLYSETAASCKFTMDCAANAPDVGDKRQHCPEDYCIPPESVRRLRAELIMEEALETIEALGFHFKPYYPNTPGVIRPDEAKGCLFVSEKEPDLIKAIDGCCDTIYVATGALLSMGAPDRPHLHAVNEANDAKFPNGRAIINKATGKYLKPEGWTPPNHEALMKTIRDYNVKRFV